MADANVSTGISTSQLQEILATVLRESHKLNPLEQRQLDEALAQDKRRTKMVAAMGRAEAEAMANKKGRCSHMRYPANAGRNAGHSAPRGALGAEWTTGGQAYQDGTAVLICTRCSYTWRFRPTAEYYTQIVQNGLMGEAPPPADHVLCAGCIKLEKECTCEYEFEQHQLAKAVA